MIKMGKHPILFPSCFSIAIALSASPCFALETKPWLGNIYEFEFLSAITYSRYNKVEGARVQLKSPSNDMDYLFDLSFTPLAQLDVQAELELANTPRQSFGVRSGALQARYQWFDDIAGDPVSFTTGVNVRGVTHKGLKDVSCPYASYANFELTFALGKEWSEEGMWTMRTYGFAAVGIANQGYPWTQELFVFQRNWNDVHRLTLFAEGLFGFGNKQHVNVRHFKGWGKVQHQSIDLGIAYGHTLGVYGIISIGYAHRVFAHNFPEHVNFVTLCYQVPFSF